MVDQLAELFKTLLVPGSATFFLFSLIIGTFLLFRGRRLAGWGKHFLLAITILGYLISTPLVASSLLQMLSHGYEMIDPDEITNEIDAIVILGGGGSTYRSAGYQLDMLSSSTSLRLLEGLRLYERLSIEWIIVSGGINDRAGVTTPESETMAAHLIQMGVPPDHILIESDSSNTHDQAINIPALLADHGISQFILVTSPTHMRRAELSFQNESMIPLTSLAPISSDTKPDLGWSPLPSAQALEVSRDVIREITGLFYYFLRGWI